MTRVDRDALARRVHAMEQLLVEAGSAVRGATVAILKRDRARGKDLCYTLLQAIQLALDVGEMVIASRGWRAAETYADIPEVLREHGVIRPRAARAMAEAARFRNVLVHRYASLDYALVLRNARSLPRTLRGFASRLLAKGVRA